MSVPAPGPAWRERLQRALTRRRVALGFLTGALVFWLARPTWRSLVAGAAIAALGEGLRVWAAGHIQKSREVTQSGPYRWTAHPLYLGTTIIGAGVAVASGSLPAGALVLVYLAATIPAAIRAEEAHLRRTFGAEYDAYRARTAAPVARAFSLRRALGNREHHTLAGLAAALALLAIKAGLWLP